MSISQRKDGRWRVLYYDEYGTRREKTFKAEDAEKAKYFDAEMSYDSIDANRLTVNEAVLKYCQTHELCQNVQDTYRYLLAGSEKDGKHREGPAEIIGTKFIDTLNRRDLETVRDHCRSRGIKVISVNRYVQKLETVFNWCADQDFIKENPWRKYRSLPVKEKGSRTGTLEDFQKMYQFLPEWMQWAARTALALCLRPGIQELFSLQWNAFHWSTKSVSIFMPKVKLTKTVYPPSEYLAEAWQRYELDKEAGYSYVCRNKKNKKVSSGGAYYKVWKSACIKAGVEMPMYALRHIAASQMLANGADIAAVAAQLGHKDITTTAGFYTHLIPSAQRRAVDALPYHEAIALPAAKTVAKCGKKRPPKKALCQR